MDTIRDVIRKAVNQAFVDNRVEREDFNHDVTCFNETSIRAAVVFDKSSMPREFIMVGLGATIDDQWKVVRFQHNTGNHDGIDAMNDVDSFLRTGK